MRAIDRLLRNRPKAGGLSLAGKIKALFSNGEQGWWYDPSNFATLFQDSAGTTPVTAVEQPVGLQLDLSKGLVLGTELVTNGDFSNGSTGWTLDAAATVSGGTLNISTAISLVAASQNFSLTAGKMYEVRATCTSRTSGAVGIGTKTGATVSAFTITAAGDYRAYIFAGTSNDGIRIFSTGSGFTGSIDNISVKELPGNHRFQSTSANRPVVSARVNLLTKTEQFDDAAWTKTGATITANAVAAPNGTATADKLVETATTGEHRLNQVSFSAGQNTFSVAMKAAERTQGYIYFYNATNGVSISYFDLAAGSVLSGSGVITPLSGGWYLCTLSRTSTVADLAYFGSAVSSNTSYAGDITKGIYIWGADLRPTNQGVGLPAYQRVNTSTDYDSTGFPVYIKPNGSNQFMVTNSIDFTATDKMTVWQGVRKLDSTARIISELSVNFNSTTGSFYVASGTDAGSIGTVDCYASASRGSATPSGSQSAQIASTAINTAVLSITHDIAGDLSTIRQNTVAGTNGTADKGTGNFGNYAQYFYARAGTTAFFNGNDYGSIARGAASTAAQITNGETYINSKTKAFA